MNVYRVHAFVTKLLCVGIVALAAMRVVTLVKTTLLYVVYAVVALVALPKLTGAPLHAVVIGLGVLAYGLKLQPGIQASLMSLMNVLMPPTRQRKAQLSVLKRLDALEAKAKDEVAASDDDDDDDDDA